MNFSMTEDQLVIRDSVRKFAEAELLPNYQRWDRTGEWLPKEFTDKIADMGLLRLRLPEKYGGQGYSPWSKPITGPFFQGQNQPADAQDTGAIA